MLSVIFRTNAFVSLTHQADQHQLELHSKQAGMSSWDRPTGPTTHRKATCPLKFSVFTVVHLRRIAQTWDAIRDIRASVSQVPADTRITHPGPTLGRRCDDFSLKGSRFLRRCVIVLRLALFTRFRSATPEFAEMGVWDQTHGKPQPARAGRRSAESDGRRGFAYGSRFQPPDSGLGHVPRHRASPTRNGLPR